MNEEIHLINNVISSLYDDYEQEQEYAQKVINAWSKILNHLAVEGYYDED
tara:strand:- start:130 stop:279 length:150 start_codon:yes stop_codon:yes gene_type:complete